LEIGLLKAAGGGPVRDAEREISETTGSFEHNIYKNQRAKTRGKLKEPG